MTVIVTTTLWSRRALLTLATLVVAVGLGCQSAPATSPRGPIPARVAEPAPAVSGAVADETYIRWLVDRSMLRQAELAARPYSSQGQLWQHSYADPQPRAASTLASAWFTAYPASHITAPGGSVL